MKTELKKFQFVLNGKYSEDDKSTVEAIFDHLRKISKDINLTIMDISNGSIILTLQGEEETFKLFQQLFKDDKEGFSKSVGGEILGLWEITSQSRDGILVDRIDRYKKLLISYFEEIVEEEVAKDLFQDFTVEILSMDDRKYEILSSPSATVKYADNLLQDHLQWKGRDGIIRKSFDKLNENKIDRNEVLRLSMQIFDQLDSDQQELIENYWSNRFEGNDLLDELSWQQKEEELKGELRSKFFGEDE